MCTCLGVDYVVIRTPNITLSYDGDKILYTHTELMLIFILNKLSIQLLCKLVWLHISIWQCPIFILSTRGFERQITCISKLFNGIPVFFKCLQRTYICHNLEKKYRKWKHENYP